MSRKNKPTSVATGLLPQVTASFDLLSGVDLPDVLPRSPAKDRAVLKAATPGQFRQMLNNLDRVALHFAKACQRYEAGEAYCSTANLPGAYLQPAYLKEMAQAMPPVSPRGGGEPQRNFMPDYFHQARWPFQFALKEAAEVNPLGAGVQLALAHVRSQQANLLRSLRRSSHSGEAKHHAVTVKNLEQKIAENYKLITPFNPLRQAMRRQALAAQAGAGAGGSGARVIPLVRPVPTRQVLRVANI